jgi:hypothetical protein
LENWNKKTRLTLDIFFFFSTIPASFRPSYRPFTKLTGHLQWHRGSSVAPTLEVQGGKELREEYTDEKATGRGRIEHTSFSSSYGTSRWRRLYRLHQPDRALLDIIYRNIHSKFQTFLTIRDFKIVSGVENIHFWICIFSKIHFLI